MAEIRKIIKEGGEVFCSRPVYPPEFKQLKESNRDRKFDNGIRVYGGHACACIQIRAVGPLTPGGKPRRLIATASYLDRHEVAALIEKLQEILPTLYQG